VPTEQLEQSLAPDEEYVPDAQTAHAVDPVIDP
jgi:hypothetical protein